MKITLKTRNYSSKTTKEAALQAENDSFKFEDFLTENLILGGGEESCSEALSDEPVLAMCNGLDARVGDDLISSAAPSGDCSSIKPALPKSYAPICIPAPPLLARTFHSSSTQTVTPLQPIIRAQDAIIHPTAQAQEEEDQDDGGFCSYEDPFADLLKEEKKDTSLPYLFQQEFTTRLQMRRQKLDMMMLQLSASTSRVHTSTSPTMPHMSLFEGEEDVAETGSHEDDDVTMMSQDENLYFAPVDASVAVPLEAVCSPGRWKQPSSQRPLHAY